MATNIKKASGLSLSTKLTLTYSVLILFVSGTLAYGLYWQLRIAQRQAIRERLLDIVSFSAPLVDGDFHSLIRSPEDENSPFYRVISLRLKSIQATSNVIKRIYTLRQQEDGHLIFVVDVDPIEPASVGKEYLRASPLLEKGLASISEPVVEDTLYTDASGTFLSGYAPIYDQFRNLDGILGIDIDATTVVASERNARQIALIAFLATVPLSLSIGWFLGKRYLALPVNDLVRGAERVAQGQLDEAVPVHGGDELGVLADAFNHMTNQLRQTLNGLEKEIAERKRTEQELCESEERLKLIFENAVDGILVVEMETKKFLISNPMICQMLGYTAEEIITLGIDDIHPEEQLPYVMDQVMRQARKEFTLAKDIPIRRKDGSIFFADVNSFPIVLDGKECIAGFFRDITKRRQTEEELRKHQEHLEDLVDERTAKLAAINQELESFSYSVSHDLRAPLRHISGYLGLLRESMVTKLDEESQQYFAAISDSAKQMGALIDDLLLFSRMGRKEMYTQQVDLGALVHEVIREHEAETRGRNIHWEIADLPIITGDSAMLRIVLVNLISNALKFTRPRQQAEIKIGYIPGAQNELVFFVSDNGVGFDMKYADKLFGVFQRLHLIDEFEGTGIGLANVQRIINRHGGRVSAEGKVNHGATFYFSLPQSDQGAK